eukprot:5732796-Lingulodinium_polyedra.AAC.1
MWQAGKQPALPCAQLRKGCCFREGLGMPAWLSRPMAHLVFLRKCGGFPPAPCASIAAARATAVAESRQARSGC